MAIMKKDVNFVFFILIIATVVSFAGFTAYYQMSFRNINEEYNTKLAELNKVTKDLIEKKAVLMQTSEELNTTKQGREELGERYDTLKEERDDLEGDRDMYKEKFLKTNAELSQKISQVNTLTTQLTAAQVDLKKYRSQYNSCQEELDECEDDLVICRAG
ncbi:hypothetical protein KY366_03850 [Candidatus Woesearchaeota archaeon]|nr:hypothetical protein [Candidatus Woesearchaeota archaeon]